MRSHLLTSFVFCGLFAASTSQASPKIALKEIVVALKPDKNPDAIIKERQSLEVYLSKELGVPVKVIVPMSGAVILEGLANGTVDLAYLASVEMLNARDRGIAEILVGGEIAGQTSYESYWIALAAKPYTSIADLKGKPIAFTSKTSTSGYLIPYGALIKKGLLTAGSDPDNFFGSGNSWYGTGYVSAVERVLQGSAEAAAISDYVMLKDKHLTAEQKGKLKIIDRQGPVPTHVIAIRAAIKGKDRETILAAVTKLNEPANTALRDQVFTSKLIQVDATKHLQNTAEALKLTGLKL